MTIKCPLFHQYLYDNQFEAALWMCFDTNKQYFGAGDVVKDVNRFKINKRDFSKFFDEK